MKFYINIIFFKHFKDIITLSLDSMIFIEMSYIITIIAILKWILLYSLIIL